MSALLGRRDFLQLTAATAATVLAARAGWAVPEKPKLRKAIKYAMIAGDKPAIEKLSLAKKVGFAGVEIDSPSKLNLDELIAASKETGIIIHGVIDSVHWAKPLSHPDEKVRAEGLEALKIALNDTAKVGADTCLLVPGVVNKDVTYDQCWERSQAEISKVIPLAEKLKVKIAIEVVWNNFLTKPEQLIQYVDDFKSEWVGAYFDASNMLKYGVPSAEWIRKLGKRMLKFDFKGYKEGQGFKVGIGEGDENWPEILKACAEIGYNGWFTAEVKSGDEAWLKDVSQRMDKILNA